MNSKTFDEIVENKILQINKYYPTAENYELAQLGAYKTCLEKIKKKGYEYILYHKKEINDCKSNYLNYNTLSWEELLKILNLFQHFY
jgi:hypothetical protein